MELMTDQETRDFLLSGLRMAKLATVREDGRPHVAPIWFDLDGDDIIFTTWHTTVKAANLRRDPRVALCVDDEKPPYAFVLLEGVATISENPAERLKWTTRIAGRYLGPELAEPYGKRNGVEGELVVRVRVTKIVAQKGIAD